MDDSEPAEHPIKVAVRQRNRFDRMEWVGAFGDLGTLIPFVVAYIGVMKLDPLGVLFAFGASMVVCGAYYKTPFPVQPMKALGAVATTQAAQTAVITQGAIFGAGLVTGIIWLILGLTGTANRIANLLARPVVVGIVLGLGIGFMLGGIKLDGLAFRLMVIDGGTCQHWQDRRPRCLTVNCVFFSPASSWRRQFVAGHDVAWATHGGLSWVISYRISAGHRARRAAGAAYQRTLFAIACIP